LSNRIAVIGIGNSLRRDDGIGIHILESLLNNYRRGQIDYLDFGSASFDIIHRLQNYDVVLLIDGIQADLPVGQLKIFSLDGASLTEKSTAISSHELNLKDIFKLTRELKIKAKIYVAGIQVEDVGFGQDFSLPLQEKTEEITKQIDRFIQERLL
jgi:hydrogenase maturation protease